MPPDLLRSVSRSFYLSLRILPAPMRGPVSLGYLLARLGDTIADAPGLPEESRLVGLEELRLALQGKRERLGDGVAALAPALVHPGERVLLTQADELIAAYRAAAPDLRGHLSEVLLTILHGQAWDLRAFAAGSAACSDAGDLLRYTYWVAGCVGEFWTKTAYTVLGERFAPPEKATSLLQGGRRLGQALQLVNILRDLHEDLPRGRCYLPADELRAAGWDGAGTPGPDAVDPVLRRWLGVCRDFLEQADSYVREVREPRVRFGTRLPQLLAAGTARLLEEAGAGRVLSERIKLSRAAVWRAAARAWLC